MELMILDNSVKSYLIMLATFSGLSVFIFFLNKIGINRIKTFTDRTKTTIDDVIIRIFEKMILPLLYFGSFYFSLKQLVFKESVFSALDTLAVILVTLQVTRFILTILFYTFGRVIAGQRGTSIEEAKSKTIFAILRFVIWSVAVIFLLDNLGFNISAVVAGLGIGGVAIALAAQTILGDLFNYFVIFFDKPFEEGDFIIVDDYLGTIENIGIKSTRIRSLGGELLVFSNSDLTGSRIRNYKRMERRRVVFGVGVVYQTPKEKVEKIPDIIREVIKKVNKTEFDRAHFKAFGNFSLDIEVVYYVLSSDYNVYMDIQEEINLAIYQEFQAEGIEFAYPTQTVFLNREEAPQT